MHTGQAHTHRDSIYLDGIDGDKSKRLSKDIRMHAVASEARSMLRKGGQFYEGTTLSPHEGILRHRYRGWKTSVNTDDLSSSGWGALFPFDVDPKILEALQPLLRHRRSQVKSSDYYKEFRGRNGYRSGDTYLNFLERNGAGPGPADPYSVPYYILIVGSPESIPYSFQTDLDVQYAVGRIHFHRVEDYRIYAETVVKAEKRVRRKPVKITFFGVSHPGDRATNRCLGSLVEPLSDRLKKELPLCDVERVTGGSANKARLTNLIGGEDAPDLLFTASHGLAYEASSPLQREYQGAIVCSDWPGERKTEIEMNSQYYFSASDLKDEYIAKNSICFFHGCFTGGTPHSLWVGATKTTRANRAKKPFIARLPQSLLVKKTGVLAVIGHLDRTWSCSYEWKSAGPQIHTFESALRDIASGRPIGVAMEVFGQRYSELCSAILSANSDSPSDDYSLASLWIACQDARNYVIVGDPAVRISRQCTRGSPSRGVTSN